MSHVVAWMSSQHAGACCGKWLIVQLGTIVVEEVISALWERPVSVTADMATVRIRPMEINAEISNVPWYQRKLDEQ